MELLAVKKPKEIPISMNK